MALNFNPIASKSQKLPFRAVPAKGALRSPKFCMVSTIPSGSKNVRNLKKPFAPPREVPAQITHSMPAHKVEIFKSLEGWAENNLLTHLKPVM